MKASEKEEKIQMERCRLWKVVPKKDIMKKFAKPNSSELSEDVHGRDESSDVFEEVLEECVDCRDNHTKVKSGWIQCVGCRGWLHENCNWYNDIYEGCGKAILKQQWHPNFTRNFHQTVDSFKWMSHWFFIIVTFKTH